MEESILISTKKILSIPEDYSQFDLDVITHINSTLSILSQLGIGPENFFISDDSAVWADLQLTKEIESMVKSYVYLKTRMLFDPPTTSFLLEAFKNQIAEFESRMSISREMIVHPYSPPVEESSCDWY